MKLHFEPNLDYQHAAIESVCDLFKGQEICRSVFTVTRDTNDAQQRMGFAENDIGIGNRLTLLDDDLLKNLNDIQLRNGLPPSSSLASGDFTVEMETGTGKTYVYLRTVFELNQRYGFNKFVIVVPSVAIKEGVYKSLQMMEDHFRSLYANVPFEYFLYDSSKLGQVRNFATSSHIQVMVVTVGAINKKDVNNLYKDSEKTGGEKPIDLIKATRPIIIVDEPQSVDGGLEGRGKEALGMMNPLCTLRYSATHVEKHHMVYRLDAVAAYERKLVKQIEVAEARISGGHNKPYVKLLSVSNKKGVITAKVELDMQTRSGVQRHEISVQDGDNLEMTTNRAVYHDCRIGEIRVAKGSEFMELRVPGGEHFLKPGQAFGDLDALAVQREMISRTIKEHLTKELRLAPQGIKVLSLFFIDSVERYRQYDAAGNQIKGDYAKIFEEEYRRLAKHPDYQSLFKEVDLRTAAEEVHNGYFSIDKKKVGGKTVEVFKDTRGDTKADDDTYSLIMREKEKLLGFETPLKFIFSHSALKEGWDNPNVFQNCALRDMGTERERRQTIGRGLRLCVNQQGERLRGFEINTLVYTPQTAAFRSKYAGKNTELALQFDHIEMDDIQEILPGLTEPQQRVLDVAIRYWKIIEPKEPRDINRLRFLLGDGLDELRNWDQLSQAEATALSSRSAAVASMKLSRVLNEAQSFFTPALGNPTDIYTMIGRAGEQKGRLVIVDLQGLSDTAKQIIAAIVSSEILKAASSKTAPTRPCFLVYEEGHSFAPAGESAISHRIIKKIAGEGRKFGVGFAIVSQRPSKLDPDVTSQCNTLITMRLKNPDDQRFIAKASDMVSQADIDELPSLSTGEALICGRSIPAPLLVKVGTKTLLHGGQSPEVIHLWGKWNGEGV